jgi:putative DNA primase/helicase
LGYYDQGKLIGNFPAMIAMVLNSSNRAVSIHRTYLQDNCKAPVEKPKKIMSPIFEGATRGGAIKLFHPYKDELAVGEGIETVLAIHFATQLPVWATLSAGGLANVIIPTDVRRVLIAVDNDGNNVGQKAADKLAKRLLAEGRFVKCVMPPRVDTDFVDILVDYIKQNIRKRLDALINKLSEKIKSDINCDHIKDER